MTEDATQPLAQFQRIAQVIRDRVTTGEYPVRSQLPSIASLADELGCSHMTIKQALATLGAEGVISTRRGVRAEVVGLPSTGPSPTVTERLSRVEAQVSELAHRLGALEDHGDKSTGHPRSAR